MTTFTTFSSKDLEIRFPPMQTLPNAKGFTTTFQIHVKAPEPEKLSKVYELFKELPDIDTEWWNMYMSNTFQKAAFLKRMLSSGDLCYVVFAGDQPLSTKKLAGTPVTITRLIGGTNAVEVTANDTVYMLHVLDLMRVQLDITKPRVYHWNFDELDSRLNRMI